MPVDDMLSGLRARLHETGPLFNAVLGLPEPGIATILGHAGWDYVVIDAEHGPFTLTSLRACVEALASTPARVVVRPASDDATAIKQLLDLGIDGIQIPTVASAAAAAAAVAAARYPPGGRRGIGTGRASGYGARLHEYLQEANGRIAVLAMVEDAAGVAAAGEIAAVDGLDGIVVGAMDLSADLGVPGQPGHPSVVAAVESVVQAALAHGTKVGTGCRPDDVGRLSAEGMSLFTCFVDSMGLADAAAAALQSARAGAASAG
jgi:4-hydroxy-2-oxoheptanedioate aldolase